MTCQVCAMPEARKRLMENLYRDGKSVEELGQSLRVDYDAIEEHMRSHVKTDRSENHESRTKEMVDALYDVSEAARLHSENEVDAANFGAYVQVMKLYHSMSSDHDERVRARKQAEFDAEVLRNNIVDTVLTPLLTDVGKIMLGEIGRLKEELARSGVKSPAVDSLFMEALRRLGDQIQSAVDPHVSGLDGCIDPESLPTTKKGRKKT